MAVIYERRRGAQLELTPIGQSILPSARMILDTIDQQMLNAVATAQSRAGNLTNGYRLCNLLQPIEWFPYV